MQFHKQESSLCHKHAVTLLTEPGHIDEQLKERFKVEKQELPPENFPKYTQLRHCSL